MNEQTSQSAKPRPNAVPALVAVVLYLVTSIVVSVLASIFFGGIRTSGVVFSLLHLINFAGGGYLTVLLVTAAGGVLLYASRRVFNNLLVPIGLHALYDVAFYLLPGKYLAVETLPGFVLDIQLGSFLVLFVAAILFVIAGRRLLRRETTGWSPS